MSELDSAIGSLKISEDYEPPEYESDNSPDDSGIGPDDSASKAGKTTAASVVSVDSIASSTEQGLRMSSTGLQ